MISSDTLSSNLDQWQAQMQRLLEVPQPADDPDVAADVASDPEAQADRVIEAGNAVFDELATGAGGTEVDAQILYFALGNLAGASGAMQNDEDVAVDAGEPPAATVAAFADLVRDPKSGSVAVDAGQTLTTVTTEFEEIENATGKEIVELVGSAVVQLSGQLLVDGLDNVLGGTAAKLFDDVRKVLHRLRDAFKRAATKVISWITERLAEVLPKVIRDKLPDVVNKISEKLAEQVGPVVGSALGGVLGRGDAQAKWDAAEAAGNDLGATLKAVATAADAGVDRIGYVSKGRKALEKFGVDVVLNIATKHPAANVAYICAMVAVFGFVSWQLWDGIRDIGALAPI